MANPLLTVVIPVYNAAHFLPEAVESIRRQEYEPLEIIVADDGSTDNCAEVAAGLGSNVRYARQENAGPAAARNHGLSLTSGEFISFLDADDLWPRHKLSIQMARLLAEPELDFVLGRTQYHVLPGGKIPDLPFEGPENIVTHTVVGSGVYRRQVFDRIGVFEESLRFGEDTDWFMRALEDNVEMRILRPTTLLYRMHGKNMTQDRKAMSHQIMVVLQRSMERRRQRGGAVSPLRPWLSYDEWAPGTRALVSAIIPTYNAEHFVDDAVRSALGQTYRPVEILVVDDGSTDKTVEKVREFGPRLRLLRQYHAGAGAARNLGVMHATGRYIAFLDADDIWTPTKLFRQMEILQEDPTCDLLFGHVQHFRETSGESGGPAPGYLPGTMLAKRELFDKTGPLVTDLKAGEFIDWYARAMEAGLRSRLEPEVWLRRRVHGANLTARERIAWGDYLRVVKAAMDRRRHGESEGG